MTLSTHNVVQTHKQTQRTKHTRTIIRRESLLLAHETFTNTHKDALTLTNTYRNTFHAGTHSLAFIPHTKIHALALTLI